MKIVSLFDESGHALRPWARAGYECFALDIQNEYRTEQVGCKGGIIHYIPYDLASPQWISDLTKLKPRFVMGFPPCTDMAVSGARHFAAKLRKDPDCQIKAVKLARIVETSGAHCGVPWFAENPVSVLSTLWRKPDHRFSPNEYGGYLPEDDIHPNWPDIIPPRDAYRKTTCIWSGNGFVMPEKKPVEADPEFYGWSKLGGKSARTKKIRSETPRGFSEGVFQANRRRQDDTKLA